MMRPKKLDDWRPEELVAEIVRLRAVLWMALGESESYFGVTTDKMPNHWQHKARELLTDTQPTEERK